MSIFEKSLVIEKYANHMGELWNGRAFHCDHMLMGCFFEEFCLRWNSLKLKYKRTEESLNYVMKKTEVAQSQSEIMSQREQDRREDTPPDHSITLGHRAPLAVQLPERHT